MKTKIKMRAVSCLLLVSLLCSDSIVSIATETADISQEETTEVTQEALQDNSNDSSEEISKEKSDDNSKDISQEESTEELEDNSSENSKKELEESTEKNELPESEEKSESKDDFVKEDSLKEDSEKEEDQEESIEDSEEEDQEELDEEELKEKELEEEEETSELITDFDELEPIETEYKLAFVSLKKKFPKSLVAYTEGDEIDIEISKWEPVTDYNEMLGSYTFAPVIDGDYEIDEEVSIPEITVKVNDEDIPSEGIENPEVERDTVEENAPVKKAKTGLFTSLFHKVGSFVESKLAKLFDWGAEEEDSEESEYENLGCPDWPEYDENLDCPDCPEEEDPDCPDYPDCPDCPEEEDPDCPDCPEYEDPDCPDCPDCPEEEDPDCPDCPYVEHNEKEIYEGPEHEPPAAYNGYEQGNLPTIRDQGGYGTCWAHATVGAIETDVINRNTCVDSSFDLSELQLAYYCAHYYDDPKNCHDNDVYTVGEGSDYLQDGGHDSYIYNAMFNGVGAVPESVVPYSRAEEDVDSKYAMDYNCVRLESINRIKTSERDNVKDAILKHGSVYTLVCTKGEYFSWMEDSMYNYSDGEDCMPDHAVTIVGWDDNFPAENFKTTAPGDGAWLIRNSWGLNDYGMNGYFWVSYYDNGINWTGTVTAFTTSLHPYDNTYSYSSSLIWDNYYVDSESATVTTDYKVNAGETIEAVAAYIDNAYSEMDVEVKAAGKTAKGHLANKYKGVYTLHLDNPIEIKKDTNVTVSLTYTDKNNGWVSVPVEYNYTLTSESYKIDCPVDHGCTINGDEYEYDPRVFLYTNNNEESSDEKKALTVKEESIRGHKDDTYQIVMGADSVVDDASKVTWESRNPDVADVDENGLVTFYGKKGNTAIIGTYDSYRTVFYASTEPYKLKYVFGDDVEVTKLPKYYYPGDSENSPYYIGGGFYKKGYTVYDWYLDEELTEPVPNCDLAELSGDLVLYPKWGYQYGDLAYYAPNEDLKSYSDELMYIDYEISIDDMPYEIPDLDNATQSVIKPESYIPEGSNMEFAYWSLDPEGEQPVTEITEDQMFKCHYSSYQKSFIVDTEVILYPQYREKKKPEEEKPEEKKEDTKADEKTDTPEKKTVEAEQVINQSSSLLVEENSTQIDNESSKNVENEKIDNKKDSSKKQVNKNKQTKNNSEKSSKKKKDKKKYKSSKKQNKKKQTKKIEAKDKKTKKKSKSSKKSSIWSIISQKLKDILF
ncbi:Cysteine protease, C1A family [Pseudobutyrivibrio sp. UC1225]|uniref:C1 family peptidase n=1 Tax=Pseudobutyrivibrio sp. UC1225 TaxID=1798185 RepID=UPI0008EE78DB|nr:C1 family peptidase [Pseudobutyrivibrio sp. UC1225]SFO14595.1 Cysteine protease, C1A family [Pseudobutyrivibrio sp. UC1225]